MDSIKVYKRNKGSKYRGVYRCGVNKWKSQIQIDGVQHYLGVFQTEEAAAREFNVYAVKYGRPEIINQIEDNESQQELRGHDDDSDFPILDQLLQLMSRMGKITRQLQCQYSDMLNSLSDFKTFDCLDGIIRSQNEMLENLVALKDSFANLQRAIDTHNLDVLFETCPDIEMFVQHLRELA